MLKCFLSTVSPDDYTLDTVEVMFPIGSTSGTMMAGITTMDDDCLEGTEDFSICIDGTTPMNVNVDPASADFQITDAESKCMQLFAQCNTCH